MPSTWRPHLLPALAGLACLALGLPGAACLGLGVALAIWRGPWEQGQAAGGQLLKLSVVLLAGATEFGEVLRVGADGLGTAVVTIGAAGLAAVLLGRLLGLPRDLFLLIGAGTAICGGSAIAAAAPALRARGEHVGLALAVVFVLNAAALLLFPLLGQALALEPAAYGRLCALAIHDTSSVVSAAAGWGQEALQVATVTKLARALWIVPVALGLALYSRQGERRVAVPAFLLGFLALSLAVELLPALRPAGQIAAGLGEAGLRLALFAIGLGLSRQALSGLGWRPMVHGVSLWILLTALAVVLCR